jgi:hypothetical protein
MDKYQPRKGSHINKKDAVIIGKRIEDLTKMYQGEITADVLVDDARPVKSPLHKYFDWDNSTAAEKWRLQQARVLMGSIVEVTYIKGDKKESRSFYNVTNKQGKPVYVTLSTVSKNKPYITELLENAQERIVELNSVIELLVREYKK